VEEPRNAPLFGWPLIDLPSPPVKEKGDTAQVETGKRESLSKSVSNCSLPAPTVGERVKRAKDA